MQVFCLIAVSHATHAAHDSKDIVIDRVHSDFGSFGTRYGRIR